MMTNMMREAVRFRRLAEHHEQKAARFDQLALQAAVRASDAREGSTTWKAHRDIHVAYQRKRNEQKKAAHQYRSLAIAATRLDNGELV